MKNGSFAMFSDAAAVTIAIINIPNKGNETWRFALRNPRPLKSNHLPLFFFFGWLLKFLKPCQNTISVMSPVLISEPRLMNHGLMHCVAYITRTF